MVSGGGGNAGWTAIGGWIGDAIEAISGGGIGSHGETVSGFAIWTGGVIGGEGIFMVYSIVLVLRNSKTPLLVIVLRLPV